MRHLILILGILVFLTTQSENSWSKSKHSKGKGRRSPPIPLQCYGGVLETHGHALSLSPALGHPLSREERSHFSSLAGQDPVPLGQLLGYFKEADEKQILDGNAGLFNYLDSEDVNLFAFGLDVLSNKFYDLNADKVFNELDVRLVRDLLKSVQDPINRILQP